jgi:hypothetical protein
VTTSDRDQIPAISLNQLDDLTYLKWHGTELPVSTDKIPFKVPPRATRVCSSPSWRRTSIDQVLIARPGGTTCATCRIPGTARHPRPRVGAGRLASCLRRAGPASRTAAGPAGRSPSCWTLTGSTPSRTRRPQPVDALLRRRRADRLRGGPRAATGDYPAVGVARPDLNASLC